MGKQGKQKRPAWKEDLNNSRIYILDNINIYIVALFLTLNGDVNMDIGKKARFRVQINDLELKKSRVITVYPRDNEQISLDEFKERIVIAIKGDKK